MLPSLFFPHDPARRRLAGYQPALHVAGDPVGSVGIFFEHRQRLPGRIFPTLVVGAAKQQIAALLPPQRPLDIGDAAEVGGQVHDRFRGGDDLVQRRIEPVDPFGGLCCGVAVATANGETSSRRRHRQHAPPRNGMLRSHECPPSSGSLLRTIAHERAGNPCRQNLCRGGRKAQQPVPAAASAPVLRRAGSRRTIGDEQLVMTA